MPDLLQTGQQWLANQLKTYASRSVVYLRGSSQVSVPAIIGRTLLKLDDGYGGVKMQWTDRDFLIQTADLVLAGLPIEPERGDLIHDPQNGKVYIYEVIAPGSEPHWRWSDGYRTLFRIHTKQIGVQ